MNFKSIITICILTFLAPFSYAQETVIEIPPQNEMDLNSGDDEDADSNKIEHSCEKDWKSKLFHDDPNNFLEVMQLISIIEQNKKLEKSGLGQTICPPNRNGSPFEDERFTSGDAVGKRYCERPNEIKLDSLPDTHACRLAAVEMKEKGIGSIILGVEPDKDKQLDVIIGTIKNNDVVVDANLVGALFTAASEYLKSLAFGEVVRVVKEGMDDAGDAQRQRNKEHETRLAQSQLEQRRSEREATEEARDSMKESLEKAPERNREIIENMVTQVEGEVDRAKKREANAERVVQAIKENVCKAVAGCKPDPDINSCQDPACLGAVVAEEFKKSRTIIKACEKTISPVNPVPEPTPFTSDHFSALSDNVFKGCRVVLVEDQCLAAGATEPCKNAESEIETLDDAFSFVREEFMDKVIRTGGAPCKAGDTFCEIGVKLEQDISLSGTEVSLAKHVCGVKESFEIPKFKGASADEENQCAWFSGKEICGEEGLCLQHIYSRPNITRWNYRIKLLDRYQCLKYDTVSGIINERFLFAPDSDKNPFSKREAIGVLPKEFDNPIADFAEKFNVDPNEINVTRAGDVKPLGLANDPLIILILGQDDDNLSAFKAHACERIKEQ